MASQVQRYSSHCKCDLTGSECKAGIRFLEHLQKSALVASFPLDGDFEFGGHVRLSECDHGCAAIFHCSKNRIRFFGGVDPAEDINAFLTRVSEAGFFSGSQPTSVKPFSTVLTRERGASLPC